MSVIEILALILLVVVVCQQAYWSWMTHKLVNKMMSGNYGHYVQAKGMEKRLSGVPKEMGIPLKLPEEENVSELDRLNAMLRF